MKTLKYIGILIVVAILLFFLLRKDTPVTPVPDTSGGVTKKVELCFAKFGQPNEQGFADAYTLRMTLDNTLGKATGELKLLPAEKDKKVGTFTGTVSPVDTSIMARRMELLWNTEAEGMKNTEELKITFGEGTANIGFGEMTLRSDGVYAYKDPTNISYSLSLTDVACSDITERENVESYLRKNIVTLSPVKATLGGTWYVLADTVDTSKNAGTVVYEDGHNQEKRNFTYVVDDKGAITSMTIQ